VRSPYCLGVHSDSYLISFFVSYSEYHPYNLYDASETVMATYHHSPDSFLYSIRYIPFIIFKAPPGSDRYPFAVEGLLLDSFNYLTHSGVITEHLDSLTVLHVQ
jgi:hypothetical protein